MGGIEIKKISIVDPDTGAAVNAENEGLSRKKTDTSPEETKTGGKHMDLRQERIKVFEDTRRWINSDPELSQSVTDAKKKTAVYYEDDYPVFNRPEINEEIAVTGFRSYEAAMKLSKKYPDSRIAVMNFANAFHAGGGVGQGAGAQEECLCRTSTLYPILDRQTLRGTFYQHHKDLNTSKASDALVYTEGVVICKTDEEIPRRLPKEEWTKVDVITIAAPDLRKKSNPYAPLVGNGTCMSNAELFGCHVKRAMHLLTAAAAKGAEILVLGAFGCGAFQNDPEVVARAYKTALQEFPKVFKRVEFAVYCPPSGSRNYDVFRRILGGEECPEAGSAAEQAHSEAAVNVRKEREKNDARKDAVRGCIFGGAAGDALGYPVEFLKEEAIYAGYGPKGITEYRLDSKTGKALISDDTQMTLFTAAGILNGDTRRKLRGIGGWPARGYVIYSYLDWLKTQDASMEKVNQHERYSKEGGRSWLLDIPELYSRRAPGNTCLNALRMWDKTEYIPEDFIRAEVNSSKGCGAIMRIAPLAVKYEPYDTNAMEQIDREAAQISAITHGHPLGYLPSVVLTHILNHFIFRRHSRAGLKEVILDALDTVQNLFRGERYLTELTNIVLRAIELSENDAPDPDNIRKLGEGWVAEETLGISLYCALRHQDDFSAGIIAAVNHNGDSDSTGAVTGNILGAMLGYDAIEEKWKKNLELSDVILETADDLWQGCLMDEYGTYRDPEWKSKYIDLHRPAKKDRNSIRLAVVYDSKTGNTKQAAEWIAEGMRQVAGADAKTFRIDAVDRDYLAEAAGMVAGCPAYTAMLTPDMRSWLMQAGETFSLAGKLGGAFATEQYTHGGGELVIQSVLTAEMVYGMLLYSGGCAMGKPVIHLGPVGVNGNVEEHNSLEHYRDTFRIYGRRFAQKALELFKEAGA